MKFDTFIVFVAPPVIGAIIGLFTNWLAIKMLFRPLKEYRVLGLRVPFTPGILPRERHGIAVSLGDTVAGDLLTEDAVAGRLKTPEFQAGLEGALSDAIERLLSATAGSVTEGLDPRLGQALREIAATAIRSISGSDAFSAASAAAIEALIAEFGPARLASVADAGFVKTLSAKLAEPRVKDAIAKAAADAVFGRLAAAAADGKSLASMFDLVSLVGPLAEIAGSAYEKAGASLLAMMAEPKVRSSMEKAAAKLLRKALDRFNAVQRFFIGLGQYDKAILENVPATVSDFLDAFKGLLAEPSTKEAAIAAIRKAALDFGNGPISGMGAFSGGEATEKSRASLASVIRSALDALDPAGLPESLRSIAGDATVRDALEYFPGARESLSAAVVHWLSGVFSGGEPSQRSLGRVAEAFAGALRGGFDSLTLGEIIGADPQFAKRLASASAGSIASLAVSESAAMLKTMDIRTLVVDKIDSLDIIEIERMLLRVMDKELKAVTWFGAVLGAGIGLAQSLLGLLR